VHKLEEGSLGTEIGGRYMEGIGEMG
jgi:hypothetical protein